MHDLRLAGSGRSLFLVLRNLQGHALLPMPLCGRAGRLFGWRVEQSILLGVVLVIARSKERLCDSIVRRRHIQGPHNRLK